MKHHPVASHQIIYRNPDLDQITGLSRTTRWRLEREGKFPARRSLTGSRAVGWLAEEVDAWIAGCTAAA